MNEFSVAQALTLFDPYEPNATYSIEMAARLARLPRRRIAVYYRHGLVSPIIEPDTGAWFFDREAIYTLRRIELLRSLYAMNPPALRLILDLTREVERLREELRRLGGMGVAA